MLDRLQAFWDLLVLQTRKSVGGPMLAACWLMHLGSSSPGHDELTSHCLFTNCDDR